MLKAIGNLVIVCVVILVLACAVSGLIPDGPPPDETLLSDYEIPENDEGNAFPLIEAALESVKDDAISISGLVRSETVSCEELSAAITKYQQAYTLLEEASEKEYYFNIYAGNKFDANRIILKNIMLIRNLTLLRLEMGMMDDKCKNECGWNCVIKYYKLASLLNSGSLRIFEHMFGYSLITSLFPLMDLALTENANLKETSLAFESIMKNHSIYEGLSNSLKGEYRHVKNIRSEQFSEFAKERFSYKKSTTESADFLLQKLGMRFFYKTNRVDSHYAYAYKYYLPYIENKPLNEIQECEMEVSPIKETLKGNFFGYLFMESSFYSCRAFYNMVKHNYYNDLLYKMLSIKIALLAYELENGSLPKELVELAPGFLTKIPADPLSGMPIMYDRDKRVIYSVGFDNVNNGGSSEEPLNVDARRVVQEDNKDIVLEF